MSKHLRNEELDEIGLQNSIKKMKIDIVNDHNQINNQYYIQYPDTESINNNNTSCNLNAMMEYESEDDYYKKLKEINRYLGHLHKLKIQRIIEKTKTDNPNNFNDTTFVNSSSSDYEPMDI